MDNTNAENDSNYSTERRCGKPSPPAESQKVERFEGAAGEPPENVTRRDVYSETEDDVEVPRVILVSRRYVFHRLDRIQLDQRLSK